MEITQCFPLNSLPTSLPMTVLSFSTCFTPLRTLLTLTLSCWACFLFSWGKKIFFLFNQKRTSTGSYHLICLLTCIYDFSPETMDRLPVFLAKAFSFLLLKETLSQQFSLLHYQHFPLHWISLFGEKKSYYFSHLRAVKQTCHSKACWKSSLCVSHFSSSTLESSPSGFHPPKTTLPSQCHKWPLPSLLVCHFISLSAAFDIVIHSSPLEILVYLASMTHTCMTFLSFWFSVLNPVCGFALISKTSDWECPWALYSL